MSRTNNAIWIPAWPRLPNRAFTGRCSHRLLLSSLCLFAILLSGNLGLAQSSNELSGVTSNLVMQSRNVKRMATNLTSFGIPYSVDPLNANFIEIHLYVSRDKGATWNFYGRRATTDKEFPFQTNGEGEYWFALRTLDRNRRLLPEGKVQPELIVTVDVSQPTFDFRVQSDAAGRVIGRWDARDTNIDSGSLTIQYRSASAPQQDWKTVPLKNGTAAMGRYADQIAWWPENGTPDVEVRATIRDTAGNEVTIDRNVIVRSASWRHRNESTVQTNQKPTKAAPTEPTPFGVAYGMLARSEAAPQSTHENGIDCENGVCKLPKTSPITSQNTIANSNQVGSQEEYVTPPNPDFITAGYSPQTAAAVPAQNNTRPMQGGADASNVPQPTSAAPQDSIEWPGQTVAPIEEHLQDSSVTFGNHRRPTTHTTGRIILPDSSSSVTDDSGRFQQEVQKENRVEGDRVVAESTARRKSAPYVPNSGLNSGPGQPEIKQRFDNAAKNNQKTAATRQSNPSPFNSLKPDSMTGTANNIRSASSSKFFNSPQTLSQPAETGADSVSHIRTKRFTLDYNIDAIDDSGVERVDLWITRDRGQTWQAWGSDPDNVSPFPVSVQDEGLYGFRVVIHSGDGLAGRPPMRGDDADMWVAIDTQAPNVKITSVPYGRGNNTGRLVINWEATDAQLPPRPISLAYSLTARGPWTTIEYGLRNEGQYAWKVGPEVPERVYLRIEAKDRAGNVGIFQLENQIDLSGLVPRGRIHGVRMVQ